MRAAGATLSRNRNPRISMMIELPHKPPHAGSTAINGLAGVGISRVAGYAPFLTSLVLGVLICVELMRASLLLFSGSASRTAESLGVQSAPTSGRRALEVHDIVAAHLFGEAARDASGQDPADPPPTDQNLRLSGTLATADPTHGVAIIGEANASSRVYSVGDDVAGASLYSVYLDHVVLNRQGHFEKLLLPKLGNGAGQPLQASLERRAAEETPLDQDSSPAPARTLTDIAQLTPTTFNHVRGFRVARSNDLDAFRASGLRPGDMVTAINGASFQDADAQAAQQALDTIQSGSTVVTVLRAGQSKDITVDMGGR